MSTAANDDLDETIKHGTYGGYQAHKLKGIPICEPCRLANNAYQRDYRKTNPDRQAVNVARQHARDRALRKLARAHPVEFRALYDAELNR
jgi:hypothetical protein